MDSDVTKNAGVSAVVYGSPDLESRQRTYIIVGNGRGGTSMVAGVIAALGVPITAHKASVNHEDGDIVRAAQGRDAAGRKLNTTRAQDIGVVRSIIAERNASFDLWGWKDPSADLYIKDVIDDLRSPHFIFVHRDIAAVATSHLALQPESDPLGAIAGPLGRLNRYWQILAELRRPTLMVSYERGRMKPDILAAELAAFIGTEVDDKAAELISRFVSPTGGYRPLA